MKIMVFTEGTLLTHEDWHGLSRAEIVRRVKQGYPLLDFARSKPIGEAVAKLRQWQRQGASLFYLTSRTQTNEVEAIRSVLRNYDFPAGQLFFRRHSEQYHDVAERILPDILIEDDCESIGGEAQMTYPHIRLEYKDRIQSVVVKEFEGIDHLPDSLSDLRQHASNGVVT